MAARSRRLFGPALVPVAGTVVAVAGPTETIIVKLIAAANEGVLTATATAQVRPAGGAFGRVSSATLGGNANGNVPAGFVLGPGDELRIVVSAEPMRIYVSGSVLSAV